MIDDGLFPIIRAYLDPGTRGLLFSALVSMVVAAYFAVRQIHYKWPTDDFGDDTAATAHRHAIVLYSEGRKYFGSFKPLMDELSRRQLPFSFLTSDPDDPGLGLAAGGATSMYIGEGRRGRAILNTLRADIVVMTPSGSGVMQIKRSRGVKHYCHVVHSPTDRVFSRSFSFECFDSLMVCGPHQARTIRLLESLKGTAAKEIRQCGLACYDFMADRLSQVALSRPNIGRPLRILVAPACGPDGLLRRYGARVLHPLLKAGLSVTVRPHPRTLIYEPEVIETVRRELAPYPDVIWDFGADPLDAMVWSDGLLSDTSQMIFDYAFLFEKPVMTIAVTADERGMEAAHLPYTAWELAALDEIGQRVTETDLESLPRIAASLCGNAQCGQRIRSLRERSVAQFGTAAPAIVDVIEDILHRGTEGSAARAATRLAPALRMEQARELAHRS